ncbi:hypothetical protein [Dactylosporangium sp. CA-139066]|uniref:hypothetical protein n=1 Tax=Dactylosporangium sp. CA-139066 TaxID=3239930 RepID=UPI003D8F6C6D
MSRHWINLARAAEFPRAVAPPWLDRPLPPFVAGPWVTYCTVLHHQARRRRPGDTVSTRGLA